MPITPGDPFHWRHYEADIILTCVRWYLDLLSISQISYYNRISELAQNE
jgi:transposase-like protein